MRLRTPRAAAIAGILFALLFGAAIILIRASLPVNPPVEGLWLEQNADRTTLGLSLVPYAGIAFLWFLGVMRDRIGDHEDRFFATILFGSGLLFLALSFMAAALAGGLVGAYTQYPDRFFGGDAYAFGRNTMFSIMNTYAMRMAGVFMISSATIWWQTDVMPRWLAILTYFLALILLTIRTLNPWAPMVFPGWVLLISITVLVTNYRGTLMDEPLEEKLV
ncbi:MAG: hypothetical protein J5I90_14435 [Caldilineales bacterium]|nr:hypothetical protein [Caldilineales bacterium]